MLPVFILPFIVSYKLLVFLFFNLSKTFCSLFGGFILGRGIRLCRIGHWLLNLPQCRIHRNSWLCLLLFKTYSVNPFALIILWRFLFMEGRILLFSFVNVAYLLLKWRCCLNCIEIRRLYLSCRLYWLIKVLTHYLLYFRIKSLYYFFAIHVLKIQF
jgi:hypothetical protein